MGCLEDTGGGRPLKLSIDDIGAGSSNNASRVMNRLGIGLESAKEVGVTDDKLLLTTRVGTLQNRWGAAQPDPGFEKQPVFKL